MKTRVNISRADLVRISFYMLPRSRSNLIFMLVLWVGIFVFLLIQNHELSVLAVSIAAVASVAGAIGGLLFGFVFSLLVMLLTVGNKSGVLGAHDFTLLPEGIRESTAANESLQRWSGILSLVRLPGYFVVRINNYLVHIIPLRSFATTAEFQAFINQAEESWRLAQLGVQPDSPAGGGSAG